MMYHEVLFLHVAKFPPSLAQQGSFYEAASSSHMVPSTNVDYLVGFCATVVNIWLIIVVNNG